MAKLASENYKKSKLYQNLVLFPLKLNALSLIQWDMETIMATVTMMEAILTVEP